MPNVEEKTVDIDTSGPDVDIKLPEEKKPETEIEVQDEKGNVIDLGKGSPKA